jgi:3-deoxy-D-manno-octulosonic-acid transferase
MRTFYTLLVTVALPFAALRLWWRGRWQPGYRQHIRERFGYFPSAASAPGPLIWLHAVSVGETRAAEPLLRALLEQYPSHRILLTHMTPTGRDAGVQLFGDAVLRCYLPYDYPNAVARFLDHFRPAAGILMETEIWPNLVRACHARATPIYLVSARLSEKSFARYQRVAGVHRHRRAERRRRAALSRAGRGQRRGHRQPQVRRGAVAGAARAGRTVARIVGCAPRAARRQHPRWRGTAVHPQQAA